MRIARFLPLIVTAAVVVLFLVACGKGGGGY